MKCISTIWDRFRIFTRSLALAGALIAMSTLAVTRAQADITVVKHHNDIDAIAYLDILWGVHQGQRIYGRQHIVSDALTSFSGSVAADNSTYPVPGLISARAQLTSTITSNGISIVGGYNTSPSIDFYINNNNNLHDRWMPYSYATTWLQFTVTSTGYYSVSASVSASTYNGVVLLSANGVVVFKASGTTSGRYRFKAGTVYEIDAQGSLYGSPGSAASGNYSVTVAPSP